MARSSVYATAPPPRGAAPPRGKRGPKTAVSDPDLVAAIRRVLSATPFHGEGYRKVRARLAHRGVAVGGKRVLRLMRQHQLLAPRRLQISVDGADRADEAEVLILRWDRERKTEVARGENQGRTLIDTNVVRGILNIATWRGEPIQLTIDLEDLGQGAGEDGYAVIVQDIASGEVLGIARVERN